MEQAFQKILKGYRTFKKKYASGNKSIMKHLSEYGQKPEIMVVACCDSRADPGVLLQCAPGELFVVRNVANIVPPYANDHLHHGTSAALEFGICYLKVKHLILLGHSQCGGIDAILNQAALIQNDFITDWVSVINLPDPSNQEKDHGTIEDHLGKYAKIALAGSYNNCLTFPWIKSKVESKQLCIHLWFLDLKTGQIFTYIRELQQYQPLDVIKKLF